MTEKVKKVKQGVSTYSIYISFVLFSTTSLAPRDHSAH